jgi:hypothetical protein
VIIGYGVLAEPVVNSVERKARRGSAAIRLAVS